MARSIFGMLMVAGDARASKFLLYKLKEIV